MKETHVDCNRKKPKNKKHTKAENAERKAKRMTKKVKKQNEKAAVTAGTNRSL